MDESALERYFDDSIANVSRDSAVTSVRSWCQNVLMQISDHKL